MSHTPIVAVFLTIGISLPLPAAETRSAVPGKQSEAVKEFYVPGMGEIMGATQMRHST